MKCLPRALRCCLLRRNPRCLRSRVFAEDDRCNAVLRVGALLAHCVIGASSVLIQSAPIPLLRSTCHSGSLLRRDACLPWGWCAVPRDVSNPLPSHSIEYSRVDSFGIRNPRATSPSQVVGSCAGAWCADTVVGLDADAEAAVEREMKRGRRESFQAILQAAEPDSTPSPLLPRGALALCHPWTRMG